uniref:RRM domain-containing protein n=1 Tax=Paramoeba aestuarina TaxID=180227 RepID=A0A7S4JH99_9EUKA|mmetsp:Transcript_10407/g.15649  ORF Transcript_10407/g.15649 Transcript_10407/m.15649 type:complete len:239 (+) Transcript_10407:33-749(+)
MSADRTIFVRPIHHNASDEDVKAFFQAYGEVEALERFSTYKKANGLPNSAFITYATEESAAHVIKAKLSYGKIDGIGNHFIPKLFVCSKAEYEQRQEDEVELKKAKKLRDQAEAADKPAKEAKTEKKPQIGENCVLKASGIPENYTWGAIKATLGDYVKGIAHISFVVHEVDKHQAYIVMKTPEGVAAALKIFNEKDHPQAARLHKALPELIQLEGDEEATFRENFSKGTYDGRKKAE